MLVVLHILSLSPTEMMTFGCRKQTAISKKEIADCSVINKVIFWHNKKVSSFPSFIFPNCSSSELISSSICYYSLHFLVHYFSSNSFAWKYYIIWHNIMHRTFCATQQNVCVAQWRLFLNQWNFPPRSEKLLLNSGRYPAIHPYPTDLTVRPQKVSMSVTTGRGGMNAIKW